MCDIHLYLLCDFISRGLPEVVNSPSLVPKKQGMLSFKQFLTQQDDSIDESEAIQLYQDYKIDFKKKQIMEFFDEHKEDDWSVDYMYMCMCMFYY